MQYHGLGSGMDSLWRLSHAKSRSISPENTTGEKGRGGTATTGTGVDCAADLGPGWKISPSFDVEPGQEYTLADIEGPGVLQQIWMTVAGAWRFSILRIYWDDQQQPSVECPVGDFFASGWGAGHNSTQPRRFAQLSSLAVCVNPGNAFNCYWPMPFRKRCRVTLTNIAKDQTRIYYQINYALTDVPEDAAYFHAQFRRVNPQPYAEPYTLLDGVVGQGHYVGTYMAWGVNNNGWWGEGEIKFFLDGDREFPTICGTGTEDYFCGSYNFENPTTHQYQPYTTPYAGLHQVIRGNDGGMYDVQQRFGMYRWHVTDPVRFETDLRVTIQALGWRPDWRYLPLQDDIASVAYWYQTLPTAPFPKLPDKNNLEII